MPHSQERPDHRTMKLRANIVLIYLHDNLDLPSFPQKIIQIKKKLNVILDSFLCNRSGFLAGISVFMMVMFALQIWAAARLRTNLRIANNKEYR